MVNLIVTLVFNNLTTSSKAKQQDNILVKKGIQSLLRDRLYQLYRYCTEKGCATIQEKENFENMYTQYHSLGKNGVMDGIHEEFLRLPLTNNK